MKKYALPLCLAISISMPTSAKPGDKSLNPFRALMTVAAAALVMTQGTDALPGHYCDKYAFQIGPGNVVQSASCQINSLKQSAGYCQRWIVDGGTCQDSGGKRLCTGICDSNYIDSAAAKFCNMLTVDTATPNANSSNALGNVVSATCRYDLTSSHRACNEFAYFDVTPKSDSAGTITDMVCTEEKEVRPTAPVCPDAACFATSTLVAVRENGQVKNLPLALLKVDQEVLSHFDADGSPVFSSVDFIPHFDLKAQTQLVRVCTASTCFDVTGDHLIPVEDKDGKHYNAFARDIDTDHKVQEDAAYEQVVSADCIDGKGLSHPITRSGMIAVKNAGSKNWIVATTRATVDVSAYYLYYLRELLFGKKEGANTLERGLLRLLVGPASC